MVVVGPEQPLVDGLVDELKVAAPQVRAFGPTKAAAELEASKAFTKDFLKACDIRTASYENFTSCDEGERELGGAKRGAGSTNATFLA